MQRTGDGSSLFAVPEVVFQFCASLMSEEIAHELATPLCLIDRLMDVLRRGEDPAEEELDVVRAEVAGLRRFVSMLRGAKPPPLSEEPVGLAELAEEAFEACALGLGRVGLRLRLTVEPTLMIRGHRDALGFVLRTMFLVVLGFETGHLPAEVAVSATETAKDIVLAFESAPRLGCPADALVPWNTAERLALPVSVAGRVARAHGFRLEQIFGDTRTVAQLTIPRVQRV